jgi:hypothetical protein
MRVELFGLAMDAPGVTFYLWSPWRCTLIEHKLFEAISTLPGGKLEREPDELRVHVNDAKAWKQGVQNMSRVLKGWQEEGVDANNEKRAWRWLLEGDIDANGYDHKGEKAAFWMFLRLSMDRGGPGDAEKGEDVDLNGFGVCVWGSEE